VAFEIGTIAVAFADLLAGSALPITVLPDPDFIGDIEIDGIQDTPGDPADYGAAGTGGTERRVVDYGVDQFVGDRLVADLVQLQTGADAVLPVDVDEPGAGGIIAAQRGAGRCNRLSRGRVVFAVIAALALFAEVYPVNGPVFRLHYRPDVWRRKTLLAVPGGRLNGGAFDIRYGAWMRPVITLFRVQVLVPRQISLPVAARERSANEGLEPGCRPGLYAMGPHRDEREQDSCEQ